MRLTAWRLGALAVMVGAAATGFHVQAPADVRVTVTASPQTWQADGAGSLRFVFRVEQGRLDPGARLAFHIPGTWTSHTLHPHERGGRTYAQQPYELMTKQLAGYFAIDPGASGTDWSVEVSEQNVDGTYHRFAREIVLTLKSGALGSRAPLVVNYGTSEKPVRASFLAETVRFDAKLDAGDGTWRTLGGPQVTTTADPAVKLLVTMPSQGAVGQAVRVHVAAQDRFGNPTRLPTGIVLRRVEAVGEDHAVAAAGSFVEPAIAFESEGVHRVEVGSASLGWFRSNPVLVSRAEPELKLYWGDLHSHSAISKDGVGRNAFVFARDHANLDFYAPSEHSTGDRQDEGITDDEWEEIQGNVRRRYDPGRFVTILGYEASFPHPDGHHNVYFASDRAPLYRQHEMGKLHELWRRLATHRAFTVPHHTGIRWSPDAAKGAAVVFKEDHPLRPLIEIYSGHGQSERYAPKDPLSYDQILMVQRWKNWFPRQAPETPDEYRTLTGPVSADGPHYARDAWAAGLQLGTIASSDDHTARPGQPNKGLAAVWAEGLDRDSIFEALRDRQTYATSGQRIYLDFRLNGIPAGRSVTTNTDPHLTLRVHATAPLEWIEVLKFNQKTRQYEIFRRWTPDTLSFEEQMTDRDFAEDTFYYVRLEQQGLVDGRPAMAWSSPIWAERQTSQSHENP
ncbi:MAG: DUF3604 domain-containing protein [Luteitalea sp.]|nr:DUF3604 domain-containing protein [Luteitalea sp.]